MGGGASVQLAEKSSDDIANIVGELGKAYTDYTEAIIDNGVDGSTISALTEDEVEDCFEAVGVSNKFHRKAIITRIKKVCDIKEAVAPASTVHVASIEPDVPRSLNNLASPNTDSADITNEEEGSSGMDVLNDTGAVDTVAFLTHDWGINEDGSKNHDTVSRVNSYLSAQGVATWFDEDKMVGDIQFKMAEGIEYLQPFCLHQTM